MVGIIVLLVMEAVVFYLLGRKQGKQALTMKAIKAGAAELKMNGKHEYELVWIAADTKEK